MKLYAVNVIIYEDEVETVIVVAETEEEAIDKASVTGLVGIAQTYEIDEVEGYKVVLVKQEKEVQNNAIRGNML